MISPLEKGVGASAEQRLEKIAPLMEYFETEMGVGAGRLMLATNFLRDAREMQPGMSPQAKAALLQAEALVVSVMIRFLNAGQESQEDQDQGCGCEDECGCGESVKEQAQAWIDKTRNRS